MESVVPNGMEWHYDEWHLSPLVKHGDFALISGVTGTRDDGSCSSDIRTEIVEAFDKLGHVLASAELDYTDIIEMTTFHIDIAEWLPIFREVRSSYLHQPWPAWSAIGITALAVPGPHLEMKATCVLHRSNG